MCKLFMFCAVLAWAVSAWAHFPIHVGETSADDGLLKVGVEILWNILNDRLE